MRALIAAAMLGAGLAAGSMGAGAEPSGVAIKMTQEAFVPAQVTVGAGTPVTWTNNDSVPHSVTALDGTFDSGPILPGKTYRWTPEKPGTVAYHCIFHPSMKAQMVVGAKP